MSAATSSNLTALRAEMRRLAITGYAGLAVSGVLLATAWDIGSALHWFVLAATTWTLVIYLAGSRLDLNRPQPLMPLYPRLGLANQITIMRGGLIAATGGFLFLEWPSGVMAWIPGAVYTFAAVLDRIDGFVARRTGQTSQFGIELDTLLDALGLAVAPLLAVWYGQIHWTYLLFSLAYYLFRWGIAWRERHLLPVYALPPSIVRRAWAGFQMGFIGVVLFPLFQPPLTRIAGSAFVLPVLIGFFIDWLTVSGRIDHQRSSTRQFFQTLEIFSRYLFLPALRLFIPASLLFLIGWPDRVTEILMLMMTVLVLVGLCGRTAALALLLSLGLYYGSLPLGINAGILIFAIVWIMLLGTGAFSLWLADERWINRHDGA